MATTTELNTATPSEAGFCIRPLWEGFEVARQAGVLPNLQGVVAAHNRHIFFERYLSGSDAARGRPFGIVSFKPDMLHDMRSVTKSIVGLPYGIALAAKCAPTSEAKLIEQFPAYPELVTHQSAIRTTFLLYLVGAAGIVAACDAMGAVLIIGRWNPFA